MNLVITQIGGCSDDTGNSLNPALTWMLCKDGSYNFPDAMSQSINGRTSDKTNVASQRMPTSHRKRPIKILCSSVEVLFLNRCLQY
ncbi:hypothetical protein V9T40_012635 [Parthenolecanium corni]|uniref:Uncharacterized protein n=1 Tax=Parthenolecanium corni TaxID=536013 RepID=A0AAN9XZL8_9HEMI